MAALGCVAMQRKSDKAADETALLHDPNVHVWTTKTNGLTVVNMRDVDENLPESVAAAPQPAPPVADTMTPASNTQSLLGGKVAAPTHAAAVNPAAATTSVTQAQLNLFLARMHGRQAEQMEANHTFTDKNADTCKLNKDNTKGSSGAHEDQDSSSPPYRRQPQVALPRSPPPPFPFRPDASPARPTTTSRSPKRSSLSSVSQDHPFPAPTQGAASAFEYMPGTNLPSGQTIVGRDVAGAAHTDDTKADKTEDGKPLVLFHDPLWGDTGGALPPAALAPRQESAGRPTARTPRRTRPFMDVPYTESKPQARLTTPAPTPTPPVGTQTKVTSSPAASNNTVTGNTTSSAAPPVVTPGYTVPPGGTPPALVPMMAPGGNAGYFVPGPRPAMGMIPTPLAAGTTATQPFSLAPSTTLPMMAAGQPQAMLPGGYPVYSFPVQYVAQPGYANMVAFNPGLQYYPVGAPPAGMAVQTQFLPPGFAPIPAQMAVPQGATPNLMPASVPLPATRPGTNIEARPFTPSPGETK